MRTDLRDGIDPSSQEACSDPLRQGFSYLQSIQEAHGGWTGDYDGPLFLLPGYIFVHYVTGRPLPETERSEFIATLRRAQNADGSFGLHLEGKGYLFTTVLNYVALRLLGVCADDPDLIRAYRWIMRMEARASFRPGANIGLPHSTCIRGRDAIPYRPNFGCCRRESPFIPADSGATAAWSCSRSPISMDGAIKLRSIRV